MFSTIYIWRQFMVGCQQNERFLSKDGTEPPFPWSQCHFLHSPATYHLMQKKILKVICSETGVWRKLGARSSKRTAGLRRNTSLLRHGSGYGPWPNRYLQGQYQYWDGRHHTRNWCFNRSTHSWRNRGPQTFPWRGKENWNLPDAIDRAATAARMTRKRRYETFESDDDENREKDEFLAPRFPTWMAARDIEGQRRLNELRWRREYESHGFKRSSNDDEILSQETRSYRPQQGFWGRRLTRFNGTSIESTALLDWKFCQPSWFWCITFGRFSGFNFFLTF